ncbi:MAG: glycosyltransferase [Planctomycetota bacterium]|nr:glycosyltransferase [Planctomycetota bacterium]
MDEVWLASDFAIEVFAAAGVERARLFKIPLSLDVERFENSVRSSERDHADGFCFLSVLHWRPASAWAPLVQAYLGEFREEEDVRMVLNFLGVPEDSKGDVSEGIRKFMSEDLGISNATPRLDVCLGPVSPDLYRSAHTYILPHHAEGSESHCMEAMASGLPVIATGCGGHTEFMSPENSWVIDFTLNEVPGSVTTDKQSQEDENWAEPSVVKLRAAMRSACDSPEAGRQKGRAARRTICDGFSREAAGELAKARLESLLKRSATRTKRSDGPPHRSANAIENTIIKEPLELFQANRFDVMAKYLYASFRERRIRSTFALHLYAEHLRLWNGFQEYDNPSWTKAAISGAGWKTSISSLGVWRTMSERTAGLSLDTACSELPGFSIISNTLEALTAVRGTLASRPTRKNVKKSKT